MTFFFLSQAYKISQWRSAFTYYHVQQPNHKLSKLWLNIQDKATAIFSLGHTKIKGHEVALWKAGLFFIFLCSSKLGNKVTYGKKKSNNGAGEFNQKSKYWDIIKHFKKSLSSKNRRLFRNESTLCTILNHYALGPSHTVCCIAIVYLSIVSASYSSWSIKPQWGFRIISR